MGLPREFRLTRAADYDAVRKKGLVQASRSFLINFLADPAQLQVRFGIIASKNLGNSVVRHAAKRRFREITRTEPLPTEMKGWLVIVVRAAAVDKSHADLISEWKWAINKLRRVIADQPGPSTSGNQ